MKYLDMDWLLVLVAIVSVIMAYFMISDSNRAGVVVSPRFEIIKEEIYQ